MLKSILNIKDMPKNLDASDGLAAALCHFYQNKTLNSSSNYSNWSSFIKSNPDKIK